MTSILRFPYDTDPSPYAETCTITSLPFLMSGQREKWSPITFVSSHKTPPLPLPRSCERFTRRGAQVAGITQYSRSVRACWKIYGIGPIKMEIYIWDFSYIWEKLGCCPFESLSFMPVLYDIYSCKSKRFRSNMYSRRRIFIIRLWRVVFRCASISWFQAVSGSVIYRFQLTHLRVFQIF